MHDGSDHDLNRQPPTDMPCPVQDSVARPAPSEILPAPLPEPQAVPHAQVELVEPAPPRRTSADPWAHRRAEPRPLALMWTGYLLLATIACLGPIASAQFLTPDIYRPAASLLLAAAALGITVFWPMIRLSQQVPRDRPSRAVFLDSIAMFFPLQAIIWPQAMPALSSWDFTIAAAVAVNCTAWLLVTGAILTFAICHVASCERQGVPAPSRRMLWMVVILIVSFGGWAVGVGFGSPAAAGHRAVGEPLSVWSPASVVFEITRDRSWLGRSAVVQPQHWRSALVLTCVAGGLWAIALMVESLALKKPHAESPQSP